MSMRDPRQTWWQAADGRWYPPASHPGYEWSGRPVHVRTGCGGLTGTLFLAVVVSMLIVGSGQVWLFLLVIPLLLVLAAGAFLRMLGRTVVMLSKVSDEAWQDAHRHAQARLADQLRFFAEQQAAGGRWGPRIGGSGQTAGAAGGRPQPPGPARDTVEWARTVLGVRAEATPLEVRHAYREASKRWHPDRFMQASAAERDDAARHMEDVNAAHAILSGGRARAA
ncbi:MAG: hypothetical protein NVSMB4_00310 [Acidimicrobiales bacterium]